MGTDPSFFGGVVWGQTPRLSKLFGLTEVCKSDHDTSIYEVSCILPEFRLVTPAARWFADIVRAAEMEQIGRRT